MTKTKDQQAQEYAKQIQKDFIHNRLVTEELAFEDIEAAWLAGYTACEQSMWRNVEEELPEEDREYLICTTDRALDTAFYEDGEWLVYGYTVAYWRELPSLPDTNTEKI